MTPSGTDILSAFYRPVRVKDVTVFDPFMGSGTTIGEAAKLGARAIGRDINPVAHFLVHNALAFHDRDAVLQTFREIERDVSERIRSHYKTTVPGGIEGEVLYYFWVKQVDCPECAIPVDLFSSRVFAKHAYPAGPLRKVPGGKFPGGNMPGSPLKKGPSVITAFVPRLGIIMSSALVHSRASACS